jgi:D-alanyl-D-alanine carboxypeptidase (penicillin-binding protein 5/6)
LLFRDPTVDGLKTGHTNAAGYCLVATAKRDLPNVGSAACCPSCWARPANACQRKPEAAELGLHRFRCRQAVRCRSARGHARLWKGEDALKIGKADGAIVVTVPSGSAAS